MQIDTNAKSILLPIRKRCLWVCAGNYCNQCIPGVLRAKSIITHELLTFYIMTMSFNIMRITFNIMRQVSKIHAFPLHEAAETFEFQYFLLAGSRKRFKNQYLAHPAECQLIQMQNPYTCRYGNDACGSVARTIVIHAFLLASCVRKAL